MTVWLHGDRGLSLGVYVVLVLTDGIDGWSARRFGAATRFGAYFDVAADIIVVFVLMGMLSWSGAAPTWLLVGPLGVTLLFLGTSGEKTPRYDPIGKYYGTLLFLLIGLMMWSPLPEVTRVCSFLIAGASLLMAVNRIVYCARHQ